MAAVIREIRSAEKWNKEWECLEEEISDIRKNQYQKLEKAQEDYRAAQEALKKGLEGQKKKLAAFAFATKKIVAQQKDGEKDAVAMASKINHMTRNFDDLQQGLPKKPGWFLRACLGSINVSLYWDKLHYKNNYETFKLRMTWISMVLTFCNLLIFKNRLFDAVFHAVLVWYYSSLTLQEHILIANGSKIKGWWVLHHYLSILLSGFLLIWPESTTYHLFRSQFLYFSLYLSFVQFLQYYYQSGVLYRLRALGVSTTMDTTVGIGALRAGISILKAHICVNLQARAVAFWPKLPKEIEKQRSHFLKAELGRTKKVLLEMTREFGNGSYRTSEGFRWWMFRGLGFLLPFLVCGYLFQLFNAYTLYHLSNLPDCKEWQVRAVSILFLILGTGNLSTLILVVKQKAARSKSVTLPCD